MSVFVHGSGICESEHVGDGTRVLAFAHVMPGARIGSDCTIDEHVLIENDVVVGDRVTVKSGVRIGRRAMIGTGAVVAGDVPAHAIVVGDPARIVGYADSAPSLDPEDVDQPLATTPEDDLPGGARLIPVQTASDLRGSLAAVELHSGLPFVPRRFFSVFGVPSKEVRGEHAHRECAQVLVCLQGSVHCIVDDGTRRREVLLESPAVALHMPPMLWGIQHRYSDDAVLGVFASHSYDPDDYIREYEQFLAEVARGG